MSILNHFQNISLTNEQKQAIEKIQFSLYCKA